MYVLGKTILGVHYYLMTNGQDRPFTRSSGIRCFWTRKRSKAYAFETLEAAMDLGHQILRYATNTASQAFHDNPVEYRHLYFGRTKYSWDIFKWLTGIAETGSVSLALFYSSLDNNDEHALSTFAGGFMSNAAYPPLVKSPARLKYKEDRAWRKQERARLIKQAFKEAKEDGTLP